MNESNNPIIEMLKTIFNKFAGVYNLGGNRLSFVVYVLSFVVLLFFCIKSYFKKNKQTIDWIETIILTLLTVILVFINVFRLPLIRKNKISKNSIAGILNKITLPDFCSYTYLLLLLLFLILGSYIGMFSTTLSLEKTITKILFGLQAALLIVLSIVLNYRRLVKKETKLLE